MKRLAGTIGMLLWILSVSAQQAVVPDSAAFPQERMYLHIDKTQYLAGEIAWFKAYLVDAVSKQPSGRSKVAYIEFIDQDNNSVLQAKIEMEGGLGAGSMMIPVNLKTGSYIIRAYTAWMKNFSPVHFFRQPVTVYNTYKSYQADSTAVVPLHIDFFPESGSLVSNLKSMVAFRAYNQYGAEVVCSGSVVNDLDEAVTTFSADENGIGTFEFTPVAGRRYSARASTMDGKEYKFSMPAVMDTGYVMHVTRNSDDIRVDIGTGHIMDEKVLLVVHQGGRAVYSQRLNISNTTAAVRCPISALQEGVHTITLFDSDGVPVAERLVFSMPAGKMPLELRADKKLYGLREKVQVTVTTVQDASLSASVSQRIPGAGSAVDMFSSVWLGSEMHGLNRSLQSFLKPASDTSAIMDRLMLTFGYRKILKGKQAPVVRVVPEIEGHIVEGTVTDTRTGKPAAHVMSYLSIPGPNPGFYCSESGPDGQVRFIVKDYFGSRELIAQTNYQRDSTYKIDIRSPFASTLESVPRFRYDTALESWLEKSALAVQVSNQFHEDRLRTFYDRLTDSSMFYSKPTDSYLLDEYKRFTTMDEVLREYVPGVVVRRRNGRNELDVVNHEMKTLFDDPLLLVDGVPVFNSESILKLDPLKVRKLQVINNRFVHGPAVFNGISSWQTYRGDLDGFTPDSRAIVIDYEGLQLQRQFYSPVYESSEQRSSRLPDYRTLLSWNPFLAPMNNGASTFSFFTSDQPGIYEVVVHGLNAAGRMASAILTFEVK